MSVTVRIISVLAVLFLASHARADLLDDIPECRFEDCELCARR